MQIDSQCNWNWNEPKLFNIWLKEINCTKYYNNFLTKTQKYFRLGPITCSINGPRSSPVWKTIKQSFLSNTTLQQVKYKQCESIHTIFCPNMMKPDMQEMCSLKARGASNTACSKTARVNKLHWGVCQTRAVVTTCATIVVDYDFNFQTLHNFFHK